MIDELDDFEICEIKKNTFISPFDENQIKDSESFIFLDNTGVYTVYQRKFGYMFFRHGEKMDFGINADSDLAAEVFFKTKLPKIPYFMFKQMILFFQYIYNLHKSEVYCRIYFDSVKKQYKFVVPFQYMTSGLVTWDLDEETGVSEQKLGISKDDILVIEAHSHHNMTGSFSSVDDADQQALNALHLVIGNIFNSPSYTLRFALKDKKVNIPLNSIFDVPVESLDLELFPNWKEHCKPGSKPSSITKFNPDNAYDDEYYNEIEYLPKYKYQSSSKKNTFFQSKLEHERSKQFNKKYKNSVIDDIEL